MSSRSVCQALRSIKSKKSAVPDPVTSVIWKDFAFELAPVISDLYNSLLREGCLPDDVKESIVHLIPKSITNDLRPLTLTSQLAKVLEGITLESIFKQVVNLD